MSIVLADLGGTHLRLAHADRKSDIVKFTISDYSNIETVLQKFAPDMTELYLASAIHPLNGMIEDKRFGDKSHWRINLADLQEKLNLKKLVILNDLEAATYALSSLDKSDLTLLLPATKLQIYFDDPPKLLIGIGTGIGHAFLFKNFVQRTHGGHVPAMGITEEQLKIIEQLNKLKDNKRDLIVEDIVSGHGFNNLQKIVSKSDAVRLFWEFLGLYCHYIAGIAGSYGGIYLTGGVMDEFMAQKTVDMESFARFFHRPMVSVVVESLATTPVYYCRDTNLPIAGLANLLGV